MHKSLLILTGRLWVLHGSEFESDVDGHLGQKNRPRLRVVILVLLFGRFFFDDLAGT